MRDWRRQVPSGRKNRDFPAAFAKNSGTLKGVPAHCRGMVDSLSCEKATAVAECRRCIAKRGLLCPQYITVRPDESPVLVGEDGFTRLRTGRIAAQTCQRHVIHDRFLRSYCHKKISPA